VTCVVAGHAGFERGTERGVRTEASGSSSPASDVARLAANEAQLLTCRGVVAPQSISDRALLSWLPMTPAHGCSLACSADRLVTPTRAHCTARIIAEAIGD
jgi:hypothetical protein